MPATPRTIAPVKRIVVTAAAMVAVLGASALYRYYNSHGAFTSVTPGFSGQCIPVAAPPGPEDIAIDAASKTAFLSTTDRRALKAGKPSPADGLYAYDYTNPAAKPVKLTGTPADFHPHGISLVRSADGRLFLFAINHRAKGGSTIVMFSVGIAGRSVALSEIGISSSDLLVSPNAIAAVDETRFYVVNDHGTKTDLGRQLDDALVLPRATILYFDGMKFSMAAEGQNFPSGIVVSRDGRYVYVSESFPRQLVTFERDPFRGTLKEAGRLDIPSNLDNLRMDAQGNLWIGTHPKAFAMPAYRTDAGKPAPSVVYKVGLQNGLPVGFTQVFADMGQAIGASSVADFADGHLLIGSAYDTKILNCRPK